MGVIRHITGGTIGIDFQVNLWQLAFVLALGVLTGYLYNIWIVREHEKGEYISTWKLVVIGVVLGLVLMVLVAWPLAVLSLLVYASLGIPLAWGDASREREALRDYNRFLRRKSNILKRPEASEE